MISKNIQEAFNKQINRELFSAYLYQAMGANLAERGLDGFANWFNIQAKEEVEHAMGFYNYLLDRGGRVELEAIEKPALGSTNVSDLFGDALEHERFVTACIDSLYKLAKEENDNASALFLHWYIREQVEEERNVEKILALLAHCGEDRSALLELDKVLATRQYEPQNIQ